MVLLKPGWENDYQGTPEIMTIGCVGKIEHHFQLPEGKYNILLSGLHRFRILHEIEGKLYRQAQPFFIGMLVGYVLGVVLSYGADVIWFPNNGHIVETW